MTIKLRYFLVCLIYAISLPAQKIDVSQLEGLKIRNIGPAGMSGRVTAIDVNLKNPQIIFAGTASGGVWQTENGGISWKPVFDEAPLQSVGSIAINQKNPAEIWVGTGEGNPRNSHNSGDGIYKSIDGGKTWMDMGLKNTRLIHRIIIDKENPNIVYAGVLGSAWGPSKDRGVYKTIDGGINWEKILYIGEEVGVADMVVDPSNPNKLLVAMWEFGRKPWTFNSGGKDSGMHLTYDGGKTWKKITPKEGLPKGELGRMGLAFAPSKPNIVYALVEAKENAFYKSTDGGEKWKKMATDDKIGNRPFYYSDIFVDPHNENRIISIHSVITKSEDGGKTFESFVGWNVHPDHHAFWIHPNDPNFMIDGNDGGLNISYDGGQNWRFAESLPLAQFYHIDYDMEIPYNICGGMQDNGSWVGPSSVWKRGGIRNSDWQEVLFGDGFDVALRHDDSRYGWGMSQGGYLSYFDRLTGHTQYIRPAHPDGEKLRFSWNAALAKVPNTSCGIYYGSQYVHRSLDCGQSWEIISPDLTTNDSTKQKQDESGGLTKDVTAAENFTTILAIAPSPVDKEVIWVGTDDGNLQITTDGGKNWKNITKQLPNCPKGAWIPQIEVSKKNPGEAFVIVNDYRRNNWSAYAYHSTNFGASWNRIADDRKVKGHCLSIVQDPIEENLLFLGTDYGLYFTIDKGKNWNKWMKDFPSVSTRDLKIHERDHDLIVGTFGRAAWIMDDIRPLRELAGSKGGVLSKDFKVFEAPDAWLADFRSVNGTRFIADGTYRARNRTTSAMVTIWNKAPKKKEESKKDKKKKGDKKNDKKEKEEVDTGKDKKSKYKKDKLYVQIFNESQDTIRSFSEKIDTGMVRITWRLNRDGIRFPSYRDVKPDSDPPGGPAVLPGRYKMVLRYNDNIDSTYINVKMDPRSNSTLSDLKAEDAAINDFYKFVKNTTTGFEHLKSAKKTIKLVNNQMVNAPDSTKKNIKKLGTAMQDSIKQLMKLYTMPQNLKGIQRSSENLTSYIWGAYSYIRASDGKPNQMAGFATKKMKKEAAVVIGKVNDFFEKDWKEYQEKVEAVRAPLFEEFGEIILEE